MTTSQSADPANDLRKLIFNDEEAKIRIDIKKSQEEAEEERKKYQFEEEKGIRAPKVRKYRSTGIDFRKI